MALFLKELMLVVVVVDWIDGLIMLCMHITW